MTDAAGGAGSSATAGGPAPAGGGETTPGFVIRDRRRIDPHTADVKGAAAAAPREATMADDKHETMASGDDAFAGAVGDDLPGGQNDETYAGRHARPGEGDGTPGAGDESTVPGVPGGWPSEGDLAGGQARPTSPTSGAASEAAARAAYADAPRGGESAGQGGQATQGGQGAHAASPEEAPAQPAEPGADADANAILAAERLLDLQRLQAEYVNYKRRVDRDREVEKTRAVGSVIESLLPVLDEIHLARQHGELENGPFAKIAAKLESVLARHGVERYGEPGDTFDPMVHEAIMHTQAELAPGTTETTVVQVMQPGYRIGDKVVRAALVAVADPS